MNRGHTLLELAVVLVVLSILGSFGVGLSRSHADRLAVNQAREEAAALLHHARALARVHGGGRFEVAADGTLTVVRPPGTVVEMRSGGRDRVRIEVMGAREEATVVFGPMGIGRAASLTLRFERGRADAALVVSSYGRIRREG